MPEEANNPAAAAATETATTATQTAATGETATQVTETSTPTQESASLIGGKFKSTEDLLGAYQNLEKEFSRSRQSRQQASDMARSVLFSEQQAGQPSQEAAQQLVTGAQQAQQHGGQGAEDAFWQSYGFNAQQGRLIAALVAQQGQTAAQQAIAQILGPVQGEVYNLKAENAVLSLMEAYPDFAKHDKAIDALIKADNDLKTLVKSDPRKAFEWAYHIARNKDGDKKATEVAAAATAVGAAQEQQRQRDKAAAAVEQPGARSAPGKEPTLADSWAEAAAKANKGARLKL